MIIAKIWNELVYVMTVQIVTMFEIDDYGPNRCWVMGVIWLPAFDKHCLETMDCVDAIKIPCLYFIPNNSRISVVKMVMHDHFFPFSWKFENYRDEFERYQRSDVVAITREVIYWSVVLLTYWHSRKWICEYRMQNVSIFFQTQHV